MKLVPFSSEYLDVREPLPFGLRDGAGRLLLAAGLSITDSRQLAELSEATLYVDEAESADWMRRLNFAVNAAIRQGASLRELAATRPEAARAAAPAPPAVPLSLPEQWHELAAHLDAALRDLRPRGDGPARLRALHGRARQLALRRPDASLYHLVHEAGQSTQKYSCRHALMTLVLAELAAAALGWPQEAVDSLGLAALTMNLSVMRLHDTMAGSSNAPSADMLAEAAGHAEASACLLQAACNQDPLAVQVVRLHHDSTRDGEPISALPIAWQLARLLCRADAFVAKIGRQAWRPPMVPVQAARAALIGAGGVPDEIGSALLKAVGMYPPGSFVQLVTGETGIVLTRGRRADQPCVAALVSASGNVLGEPALRDTGDRRHAVKCAVAADSVKVRPPHERLLAMR